jgi:hypothetical protein
LNAARVAEFGKSDQSLVLRTRARTANNCVARDIVRMGDQLLFGYNVFIGLRKETSVSDVFGLYRLAAHDGEPELEALPLAGSFLEDARFASDFKELYAYYKQRAAAATARHAGQAAGGSFQIGQQVQTSACSAGQSAPTGSPPVRGQPRRARHCAAAQPRL